MATRIAIGHVIGGREKSRMAGSHGRKAERFCECRIGETPIGAPETGALPRGDGGRRRDFHNAWRVERRIRTTGVAIFRG